MRNYETLLDAVKELRQEGYDHDFYVEGDVYFVLWSTGNFHQAKSC